MAREVVLVDDCAQDNGDGGGGLAEEGEGCGGGCHVRAVDVGLEGDKGGLEERANAYTGDDLVDDDAGPGGVIFQVDEKAEAKGHEAQAADDQLAVATCLFDDDACACGDDGEAKNQGEDVDAAEDRGGLQHGLEVEREVVGAGDEDEGMAEADDKDETIVPVFEKSHGNQRILGEFPLVQHH